MQDTRIFSEQISLSEVILVWAPKWALTETAVIDLISYNFDQKIETANKLRRTPQMQGTKK